MPGKRTTLKQLIDSSLLPAGIELTCEPHKGSGEIYQASLNSDGLIVYQEQTFSSPSSWAKYISGGERNGWDYVHAEEKPLRHFRQKFRDGIEPSQETQPVVVKPEPVQYMPQDGIRPVDADSLTSEVDSLKVQVANQQSAIANLNAKIESLSVTAPESVTEDDVTRNLRERVLKLEPHEFERLVGEYLKAKGFSNVVVSGRSHDGGIDGECELPLIDVKVAFQAKRYAGGNNIGIDPVQRLNGSLGSSYDRGVFITTSEFTSFARGWVEEEQVKIALIDGDELVKQMVDLGLGVRTTPVIKSEVDEGFFADLENRR